MKCYNLNCKYELSKKEKHYFCCPVCGEIIPENLEKKTSFERLQIYQNILNFQRHLKKEQIAVQIYICIWLVIEIGALSIARHHLFNDQPLDYGVLIGTRAVSMAVLFGFFLSYVEKYKVWRDFFGEIAYGFQELQIKIIKWMILFGIAMFMSICIIPNYYGFCMDIIESFKPNEVAVKALTFLYYVSFWYICIGIVLFDISDVYRRKFCESMSESCDSGVNL